MTPPFIPGIELCRRFYWEAVRPILDAEFPDLRHSAALIGPGSEVLGFDTAMSTDHHWGPRAMLFLAPEDHERYHEAIHETFRWRLPHSFLDYPTNFGEPDPDDNGTRLLQPTDSGPVEHRVETFTIEGYVRDYLGVDISEPLLDPRSPPSQMRTDTTQEGDRAASEDAELHSGKTESPHSQIGLGTSDARSPHSQMRTDTTQEGDRAASEDAELHSGKAASWLSAADWLAIPQQRLRSFAGGTLYHDALGLADVQAHFAYYPKDVWLYLMAASWQRIGQEEHLMSRAGFVGDDLGSALIAARLMHDCMLLCFLMERQYAPYAKWLGTAFMRLRGGPELEPVLRDVLRAETWQTRADHLATAYEYLARKHNALGITEALAAHRGQFFSRPFPVIHGERFATALLAEISDPEVRRLAERPPIGGIDQVSDNTDVLENTPREVVQQLYE